MRKMLLMALPFVFLAACTSDHYITYNKSNVSTLEPTARSFTNPLISDITVGNERITFELVYNNDPVNEKGERPKNPNGNILTDDLIEYMRVYTLTQAAIANDADIIVCPIVCFTTSDDGRQITVKVTGYAGRYTNFRTAQAEDFELIRTSENEALLQKLAEENVIIPHILPGSNNWSIQNDNEIIKKLAEKGIIIPSFKNVKECKKKCHKNDCKDENGGTPVIIKDVKVTIDNEE